MNVKVELEPHQVDEITVHSLRDSIERLREDPNMYEDTKKLIEYMEYLIEDWYT